MSDLKPAYTNGEATTPILRFATQRTESAFNEIPVMYVLVSTIAPSTLSQAQAAIYKELPVQIYQLSVHLQTSSEMPASTSVSSTVCLFRVCLSLAQ